MIYTINRRIHNSGRGPNDIAYVPNAAVLEFLQLVHGSPNDPKRYVLTGVGTLGISLSNNAKDGRGTLKANLNFRDSRPGRWSFEVKHDLDGSPNFVEAKSKAAGHKVIEFLKSPVWEQLRTPKTGDARPGGKHRDRKLGQNPEQAKREREARVVELLKSHWPEDLFRIENHAEGVQIGADFRIVREDTGETVALADAKSSPKLTTAQRRKARELYEEGVPYWMVGDDWKLCFSPSLTEVPVQWAYSEPKQILHAIAA